MRLDCVETIRRQASIRNKITNWIDRRKMQIRSQGNNPVLVGGNKGKRSQDQAAVWFLREGRERKFDVRDDSHRGRCQRHAQRGRSCFGGVQKQDLGGYGRIVHERYSLDSRRDLLQQVQPLSADCRLEVLKSRNVSARAPEIGNKATLDRVGCTNENDRDGLGRFLQYRNSWIAPNNDYIRPERD